jgi:hypothetical protein
MTAWTFEAQFRIGGIALQIVQLCDLRRRVGQSGMSRNILNPFP